MYDNIKSFKELNGLESKIIGRKASRIAKLHHAKIQVPRGFVITNAEFFNFLQQNNIKNKINDILANINYKDPLDIKEKSDLIKHLILKSKIDNTFKEELAKAYNKIGETNIGWLNSRTDEYVAIRCSVVCEDKCIMDIRKIEEEGGNLNVKSLNLLISNIKECWASLYSANIIEYTKKKFIDINKFSIAIIIQKMIDAKQSGIMITSKDYDHNQTCIIEAVFGIGGRLIIKNLTPDHYEVKKKYFELKYKKLETQKWMLSRQKGHTCRINLSEKEGSKEKLDKLALKDLTVIAKKIEDFFGTPQKIEFVINKKDIYILNSESVDYKLKKTSKIENENRQQKISAFKSKLILKGVSINKGVSVGKVVIINTKEDLNKINENSIIVTNITNPEMIKKIKICKGVITNLGSTIGHTATTCRKLNVPCVINTKDATKLLFEGQRVQIDADNGEIYMVEGGNIKSIIKQPINTINNKKFKNKIIQTIKKIKDSKNKINSDTKIESRNKKSINIREIQNIDLDQNKEITISLDYIFSKFEILELKKLSKKEILTKIREKLELLIKNI